MISPLSAALLREPSRHPLRPASAATAFGATMVVAPHPDDESLGCGGLLALLAKGGQRIQVLFTTDGSRSHPGSLAYPAARLACLREQEALAALGELGVAASSAEFLRFLDCELPGAGHGGFDAAVARIREYLVAFRPDTLLVPWRRDPHCDHVSTWALLRVAVKDLPDPPRWLEYPIWAWKNAEGETAPQESEAVAWRLDISDVRECKARAIQCHRSQLGEVIRDDPTGFFLTPAMLAHFAPSWELFLSPVDV